MAAPAPVTTSTRRPPGPPPAIAKGMVWVDGGTFTMGSDDHYPEEAPAHRVTVDGFWMDEYLVTNQQFRRFVKEAGYTTVAERAPRAEDYPGALPDMLVAGSVVFAQPSQPVDRRNHYNWWTWVPGADWRHPEGPGSDLSGRDRHPVVHVAAEDAEAYAAWAGKTLPTEAEWEFAARGGLDGAVYAWGDEFAPKGQHRANTWQGDFPLTNTNDDGYARTSPVGSFRPNGYGLYDVIGNVWEWTTDWYAASHEAPNGCCGSAEARNPTGAAREVSFDPATPDIRIPRRVIKGGSFLCAPNYCRRYRPAARMHHPVDTGTCHIGFRCIVRT